MVSLYLRLVFFTVLTKIHTWISIKSTVTGTTTYIFSRVNSDKSHSKIFLPVSIDRRQYLQMNTAFVIFGKPIYS